MNGFIVVNKEKGLTSHDVVFKLRKILGTKKIGHTGTLDPDTTGVLAVAVGEATKLIQFLEEKTKTYICTVRVGIATDTEDISGKIVASKKVNELSKADVISALNNLKDLKEQIPPMYSAVKVEGKKLYEYAREGKVIERKARPIKVFEAELLSDVSYDDGCALFTFKVTGSKGIYVRTLCVTLGEILGYPACMEDLVRTRSGNFYLENSSTLEEISNGKYELVSMVDALEMEKVVAMDWDLKNISNGVKLLNRYNTKEMPFALLDKEGKLLAIYGEDEDKFKIKSLRGFNGQEE